MCLGNRTPITVSTNYRLADAKAGTRLIDGPPGDHAEEFVQEIQPPIRLIIFGDFFDAEAVAHLGDYLGGKWNWSLMLTNFRSGIRARPAW